VQKGKKAANAAAEEDNFVVNEEAQSVTSKDGKQKFVVFDKVRNKSRKGGERVGGIGWRC
jgi:hypothetical protein